MQVPTAPSCSSPSVSTRALVGTATLLLGGGAAGAAVVGGGSDGVLTVILAVLGGLMAVAGLLVMTMCCESFLDVGRLDQSVGVVDLATSSSDDASLGTVLVGNTVLTA
jgi:hypothetical protein